MKIKQVIFHPPSNFSSKKRPFSEQKQRESPRPPRYQEAPYINLTTIYDEFIRPAGGLGFWAVFQVQVAKLAIWTKGGPLHVWTDFGWTADPASHSPIGSVWSLFQPGESVYNYYYTYPIF